MSTSKIKTRVKNYLINNGSITGDQAREHCSTTRLSQYIHLLRNEDSLVIKTVFMGGYNQFQEPCKWAKYVLITENTGL